ncbi:alpha/beta hydrolase [Kineococcus sp. NUM-3379]
MPTATTSRELRFPSGPLTLAGTLTVPAGTGPHPAVLLIPGSGPVDRDSDHRRLRLGASRELAGALTAAGFATLRYDKRGVGASEGDWRATGMTDNAHDARAALDALRTQPGIDPSRVLLAGHSEGALLATQLAGADAPVDGVALLSSPATRGEDVLLWQAERIAPTLPAPVRLLLRALRTDLTARIAKNHATLKATTTDVARIGGVRVNARWHREFLAYDPSADLARIRVPVLAVTGEKDLQVDPGDVERIADLVPGPVETHRVPDVTHVLRPQPGRPSLTAYRREVRGPLDPRVVRLLVDWATRVTRA